jgi:hypothetical protein
MCKITFLNEIKQTYYPAVIHILQLQNVHESVIDCITCPVHMEPYLVVMSLHEMYEY